MSLRALHGAIILLAGSSASAAVINVPADEPTIQAALDAAANGDEIVVAPGVYAESGLTIAGKVLTLRSSGGAGVTTIDGGGAQVLDLATSISNQLTLEGFTITGSAGPEAAIELGDDSILTLRLCTVTGNTADTKPAGVDVESAATLVAEQCTFSGNTSTNGLGGAIRVTAGTVRVIDCTFTLNSAPGGFGGAIRLGGSGRLEVRGTTFGQNSAFEGGAVSLDQTSIRDTAFHQCVFTGNTAADDGGAVACTGSGTHLLNRCTFEGNSALGAGAVLVESPGHLITDCTFIGNDALDTFTGVGGAIGVDFFVSSTRIENCRFFANTATVRRPPRWTGCST
ncbi:MAG: right-handed parallel beta-helix repeat-containing protein [Planctomycetota bacterium]|jgi:predicted outer membrane repeat protein